MAEESKKGRRKKSKLSYRTAKKVLGAAFARMTRAGKLWKKVDKKRRRENGIDPACYNEKNTSWREEKQYEKRKKAAAKAAATRAKHHRKKRKKA